MLHQPTIFQHKEIRIILVIPFETINGSEKQNAITFSRKLGTCLKSQSVVSLFSNISNLMEKTQQTIRENAAKRNT